MTPVNEHWGPREFGYMFARLAIFWAEHTGRSWRGQNPASSEWHDLRHALGHWPTPDDRWQFQAGWFAAQAARDAGEPVLAPTVQA